MRSPAALPFLLVALTAGAAAQTPVPVQVPDLREEVTGYAADLRDLERRYDVPLSGECADRFRSYLEARRQRFAAMPTEGFGRDALVDLWLLRGDVEQRLTDLERERAQREQALPLLPHAGPLVARCEARRRMEPVDPEAAAAELATLAATLAAAHERLDAGAFDDVPLPAARRAVALGEDLHRAARAWFEFHDGYDPMFSWWARAPWRAYDEAQQRWLGAVRQRLVDGRTGDATLVGDPIGETALLRSLRAERIPYTPQELVAIAEREFAWCEREAAKYAAELGCDSWHAALERTKQGHVAPGEQPQLIRRLADEAVAFLDERDLITIPELARECWRMSMMSPAAQRVNPFFLGGETIQVSFPTDAMEHDLKLQSLRSNNEHFCRATVHHELIPGHWLQQYTTARHRTWRRMFSTPFWIEGWALYWEMRLYDLGLAQSPQDRIGMLYWRKHRCARIVFSLNFHLGNWTAPECVDYLIQKVGHEPAAAAAEVRRSVGGDYGPLYQAAYMLGGLQLRALHGELVGGGAMTERAFHDAVLQQNSIPIALVRAALSPGEPTEESVNGWRFADVQ
ncbi:MAG: DUF885 family protein [Planctomycetota bacterium]